MPLWTQRLAMADSSPSAADGSADAAATVDDDAAPATNADIGALRREVEEKFLLLKEIVPLGLRDVVYPSGSLLWTSAATQPITCDDGNDANWIVLLEHPANMP